MMFFDPEFLDRRLAGKGLEPLSADPKRKSSQNQPSRSRIAVPLFSKPADYVPGSGPPLRPISLLPAGDSTAYILERVLLPSPGPAPNGKPLPKRMAYLIGWRDLRAASMVVPAMQVLEYVSPRTLEEFEAKLEQEVDDEKEKLRNEFKSGLEAPQKKKKRGRPPAHSQIKSAVVAEPEPVAETPTPTKPRHKKGVISLSTPQKSRLADFEWLSEDDGSPSRQIAEEQFQSLHGFLPEPEEGSNVAGDTNDALATGDVTHPVRAAPQASLVHITSSDPAKQKEPSASPNPEFAKIKTPAFADVEAQKLVNNKHSLPPVALSVEGSNWGKLPPYLPPSSSAPSVVQAVQAVQTQAETQNPIINLGEEAKVGQKQKQSKKRPRPEDEGAKTEAQEDNGWVVERIEDVEYYEVDGIGLVRYFKVSWEGDWPPDQKRTWEPEENIPPNLVRNFFKNSRNKRRALSRRSTHGQGHSHAHPTEKSKPAKHNGSSSQNTHTKKSSFKQGTLSWPAVRSQYKSVSEAFAAEDYDDGLEMMDDDGYEAEEEDVSGNGQNEYFVVTEDGDDDLHGRSLWPSAGALSSAFGVLGGLQ
ncbi:uncharacterized protein TrAtP1_007518 [Trichoderma atroviride]|uniref:uncharacterized protein n=1 Tax=Hypocrea atroviridis TaxID=63577 RepID=UPI0033349041|nr:hypothetical protein TrAtP1_007518 [Trichoderma atroviride]